MKPFDLNGLKTYELRSRPSKVFVEDLGQPVGPTAAVGDWLDNLPRQLGRQYPAAGARSPLPRLRRRQNRGRGHRRPCHQDRLRAVPHRLDQQGPHQGHRNERLRRHPRFRAGGGGQDQ